MPIELTIVTPEGQAFGAAVEQVVLPGAEGDFGVLAGHERFLAPLRIGPVEIKAASGNQWAAISGGFAEVNAEQVTVLVDACELASELNAESLTARSAELDSILHELTGSVEDERRRAEVVSEIELIAVKRELLAN